MGHTVAAAQAEAEPGPVEAHLEGSGFEFDKPEPIKAKSKPQYLGQAKPEHHWEQMIGDIRFAIQQVMASVTISDQLGSA